MSAGPDTPFLSVVVPTHNRPDGLKSCLGALARSAYPGHRFEVVVVDDGGKIPLESTVDPFREALDVQLVLQERAGAAAARNTGAERARGVYLAFTDDDCMPSAGWLGALADRFRYSPDALVGGRTLNALPENPYASANHQLVGFFYSHYNADPDHALFAAPNNLGVPAEAFRDAGGFDVEASRTPAGDRELCSRWTSLGRPTIYAPEAVVHHARPVALRAFWRQHFEAGRHARSLRDLRSAEPLSFYRDLVRYPLAHQRGQSNARRIAALVAVSQVANAAGFFYEAATARRSAETGADGPVREERTVLEEAHREGV